VEVGYPNPKPIGATLVCLGVLWVSWRCRRGLSLAPGALVGAWCVMLYFMVGAQVHENHAYLAVPALVVAAGLVPAWRRVTWAISILTSLNMFLFYGLGTDWSPSVDRALTAIDVTVWLAAVNVGLFVWLTVLVWHATTARRDEADASPAQAVAPGAPLLTVRTNVSSRLSD
jgi:hypothetical protein